MDDSYDRALSAKYSKILFGKNINEFTTYGFECGNGWFQLLDGVFRSVARYEEVNDIEIRITQVKEKFGQLRIYKHDGDENIALALYITEHVSACVCEQCGKTGAISSQNGWLQSICNNHPNCHVEDIDSKPGNDYANAYAGTVALIVSVFESNSLHWLQQECIALGGKRPYELLGTKEGCLAVYTLIKRLKHGVGV
jgi:hypothetical protein